MFAWTKAEPTGSSNRRQRSTDFCSRPGTRMLGGVRARRLMKPRRSQSQRSDDDVIEVDGDPTVRKRLGRFTQNLIVPIAAREVGQHELIDVARGRKPGCLGRGQMAI